MFVRVVTGIVHHLPDRMKEWLLGFTLIYYGLNLSGPETAWANVEAWAYMLSWGFTENQWGTLFVAIGIIRIVALVVNGTFTGTLYSRWSPWVRVGTSAMGSVLWFMVYQSVSYIPTSGKAIYHLPLMLEVWCSLRILYLMGRGSTQDSSAQGHVRFS